MSLVALKNVRPEIWQHFKSESARHGLTMGKFFEQILVEHSREERKASQSWDHILHGKPLLTKKEAELLRKEIASFRKDVRFREP